MEVKLECNPSMKDRFITECDFEKKNEQKKSLTTPSLQLMEEAGYINSYELKQTASTEISQRKKNYTLMAYQSTKRPLPWTADILSGTEARSPRV